MADYSGGDTVDVDPRHYLNVFRRYAPLILGTVVLFVVISVGRRPLTSPPVRVARAKARGRRAPRRATSGVSAGKAVPWP